MDDEQIWMEIKVLQKRTEFLILATPSGKVRNDLTEANIALMSALAKQAMPPSQR